MSAKPLNDTYIRKHIKTTGKAYKVFDGHGLHLYVTPKGSKLWRHKYRFKGKEKLISYGYLRWAQTIAILSIISY